MKKLTLVLASCCLSTTALFAQFEVFTDNDWFKNIGRQYDAERVSGFRSGDFDGLYVPSPGGAGFLVAIQERKNPISGMFISWVQAGYVFMGQDYADIMKRNFTPFKGTMPFGLKFGQTVEELKGVLGDLEVQKDPKYTDCSAARYGVVPGFSNLDMQLRFRNNKLMAVEFLWMEAGDNSITFYRPADLKGFDIKTASKDRKYINSRLTRGDMITYLESVVNGKESTYQKGLTRSDSSYVVNKDGTKKVVNIWCVDELKYKYALYDELETMLNGMLGDVRILKKIKDHPLYGKLEPYKGSRTYDKIEHYNEPYNTWGPEHKHEGEEFFYHVRDEKAYLETNKFPVFHIYMKRGTNEVVMETIMPNDLRVDKPLLPADFGGNAWLSLIGVYHTSGQLQDVLTYLRKACPVNSSEKLYSGDRWNFPKAGISITTSNNFVDEIVLYSPHRVHTDFDSYSGKLPEGLSFNSGPEDLDALPFNNKTPGYAGPASGGYKFIYQKKIRIQVSIDGKKKIDWYRISRPDHEDNKLAGSDSLPRMGYPSFTFPPLAPYKEESAPSLKRHEFKYQGLCTPSDKSVTMGKEAYFASLGFDMSDAPNPKYASMKSPELLHLIGRPISGKMGEQVMKIMSGGFMLQSIHFEGEDGKYRYADCYIKVKKVKEHPDIHLVTGYYLSDGDLDKEGLPFGIKGKMSPSKIKSLFPGTLKSEHKNDNKVTYYMEYDGLNFSFIFFDRKLFSVDISQKEY